MPAPPFTAAKKSGKILTDDLAIKKLFPTFYPCVSIPDQWHHHGQQETPMKAEAV